MLYDGLVPDFRRNLLIPSLVKGNWFGWMPQHVPPKHQMKQNILCGVKKSEDHHLSYTCHKSSLWGCYAVSICK
jgi:hypothetical protein